jgi:hypothetical protein
MRFLSIAALVGTVTAAPAVVIEEGDPPKCLLKANGETLVQFTGDVHTSFKCAHNADNTACACTLKHPTHHTGLCREIVHTSGKKVQFHGDCTDSGLNSIAGGWSDYSAWTTCTKSCGTGTQTNARTCTNPAPFNGGADCAGSPTSSQSCNTHECPVDGAWSGWSYGVCSKSCGTGTQSMTRTCDGQNYGGADCAGSTTSSQSCNTHECPVDGVWSGWTYGTCSTSCAAGTRTGTRTCQGLAHGGADCPGSATGSFACDHGPCPIHCSTSAFSAWTTCTKSCGTGSQTRTRSIITHADHGGYVCPYLAETRNCNANACAIDGTWSSYTAYSTCSKSCAMGTQSRTRTCDGKAFGGKACVGSTTDSRNCNTHACPVNGAWSGWTAGSCSTTCGDGTKTSTRTCDGMAHGGNDCSGLDGGSAAKTESCKIRECPYWGQWEKYSDCKLLPILFIGGTHCARIEQAFCKGTVGNGDAGDNCRSAHIPGTSPEHFTPIPNSSAWEGEPTSACLTVPGNNCVNYRNAHQARRYSADACHCKCDRLWYEAGLPQYSCHEPAHERPAGWYSNYHP